MDKRPSKVIKSEELSSKYEPKYIIVINEILQKISGLESENT